MNMRKTTAVSLLLMLVCYLPVLGESTTDDSFDITYIDKRQ